MFAPRPGTAHRRTVVAALAAAALGLSAGAGTAGAQGPGPGGCTNLATVAGSTFPSTPLIDNGFFPLTPGTRWVLEGRSTVNGAPLPHRVTFVVTDLTKVIAGVRTRIIWDVDTSNGVVSEAELAFFAQDAAGNVWTMGEYPEEYQNGQFIGAPATWIHGLDTAEAGILLPGSPTPATPEWVQGNVPSIGFLDCGVVGAVNQTVTVPAGTFTGSLVVNERSPLEPASGMQIKYYAPNVGNVRIGAVNDPQNEELVLVERTTLDAAGLQAAREAALTLDNFGYTSSPVYAQTPRAELPPGAPPFTPPDRPAPPPPKPPNAPPTITPTPAPPPKAIVAAPRQLEAPTSQADFVAKITNPYFPISAFRSTTMRGTERNRRTGRKTTERVLSRLRGKPVTIAGIRTTAVDVREYENGKLVERTTDFYAQDRTGNVWYFGERVDDIENGRVTGHGGQWEAGKKGAKAGLFMPAQPKVGDVFKQEQAPGVAEDTSRVVAAGQRVRTPLRRFSNCIKTHDTTPLESGRETKFYCRGIGLVREGSAPTQLVAYRRAR